MAKEKESSDVAPATPSGGNVASPTGLVPLAAAASTPEAGAALLAQRTEQLRAEEQHPRVGDFLSDEVVEKMTSAERYAVAQARGYAVRGRRISTEHFLELQKKDDSLKVKKD